MVPIIVIVTLATAGLGVQKGVEGFDKIQQAEEIANRTQRKYDSAVKQLESDWEETNKIVEKYAELQIDIKIKTIGRFITFIECIGQCASQADMQFLEGLEISVQQLKEYQAAVLEAKELVTGGVTAAVTGAAAGSGVISLARSVGTVSVTRFFGLWTTEVAISQLSGAAARSAAISWLGGGSMAAGGAVVGGTIIAPALMVFGLQLAAKGEKAMTEATARQAEAKTKLADIIEAKDYLTQVRRGINEVSEVVRNLNRRADLELTKLESLSSFDSSRDASKFHQVVLLVTALAEIIKTPIFDSEGNFNNETVTITAKYRHLGEN